MRLRMAPRPGLELREIEAVLRHRLRPQPRGRVRCELIDNLRDRPARHRPPCMDLGSVVHFHAAFAELEHLGLALHRRLSRARCRAHQAPDFSPTLAILQVEGPRTGRQPFAAQRDVVPVVTSAGPGHRQQLPRVPDLDLAHDANCLHSDPPQLGGRFLRFPGIRFGVHRPGLVGIFRDTKGLQGVQRGTKETYITKHETPHHQRGFKHSRVIAAHVQKCLAESGGFSCRRIHPVFMRVCACDFAWCPKRWANHGFGSARGIPLK